jgi:hypothetical protein
MATFAERMIGAAKLDVNIYEEVEADTTALGQAMAVVILSSLAAGMSLSGRLQPLSMLTGTLAGLIGWFIWAGLTYFIGARILPTPQTRADWGQLLRVTGFAASPGILRFLGFLPMLGPVINFITGLWMLAAFVVAVRQALDYTSTWRAVGVCLIGWVAAGLLMILAGRLLPTV